MANKRKRTPSPDIYSDVWLSDPSYDRESTFIGAFSPSLTRKQLQSLPKFRTATHRIVAWRIPSKQTTLTSFGHKSPGRTYDTGFDDDGEKWAGKRLQTIMERQNLEGCLVVARWYGGIMLGQVRFVLIEAVAKEAVHNWKDNTRVGPVTPAKVSRLEEPAEVDVPPTGSQPSASNAPPQTMRPEEVQRQRQQLVSDLQERDNSISVLRKLLDQKRANLGKSASTNNSPAKAVLSPSNQPDYSSMTLIRLRALEKGRDASISYLLKELNKADKEQEEEDELDAAFTEAAEIVDPFNTKASGLRNDGNSSKKELSYARKIDFTAAEEAEMDDVWAAMEAGLNDEPDTPTKSARSSSTLGAG